MTEVYRACEKCGNEYNVDREDTTPLCHSCYLKANDGEGWYAVLQTGSGCIEVIAPVNKIRAVCHSGSNDEAVEDLWLMDMVQAQLQVYSDECVQREFKELGIEEDGRTFTRADMERYLLWSLSWDFVDGGYIYETDEYLDLADTLRNMLRLDLVQTIQDIDNNRTYTILEYKSVGEDNVYLATETEGTYMLSIEDIVDKVQDGEMEIEYKNFAE